jgi:hypothetical protein
VDSKFVFAEHDEDPDRCQGKTIEGACQFKRVPPSIYCVRHGANIAVNSEKKEELRTYRAAQWQVRIGEFADSDRVKSLREDIGVLRLVLEQMLMMCKDSSELLLYSSRITDTVTRIEKLVSSCHRLEASTGGLLDKGQAIQLAGTIVTIIGKYVKDQDSIDMISNEIISSIVTSKKVEDA